MRWTRVPPFVRMPKLGAGGGSIGIEAAVHVVFLLGGLALLSKTHD